MEDLLNSIRGNSNNGSSKAVSVPGAVDEEMILRLSDSNSLEGLPHSDMEGESSDEMISAQGSMNSN